MVHRQWYNKVQRELGEDLRMNIQFLKLSLDTAEPIKIFVTQNNIRKSTDLRVKIRLRFILSGMLLISYASPKKSLFR